MFFNDLVEIAYSALCGTAAITWFGIELEIFDQVTELIGIWHRSTPFRFDSIKSGMG